MQTELTYIQVQQGSDPTAVMMLLHGIGANEQSVNSLAAGIDPRLTVISVRAPLTMGPKSFAWYPTQFGPSGPVIDAAEAEQGRMTLVQFVASYRAEHKVKTLGLMGFSQGAIMAVAAALSAPCSVQFAVGFSGRFPREFEAPVKPASELAQTSIWLAHGREDQKLPIDLGRSLRDSLEGFGADYKYTEFTAGHEVTAAMLSAAQQWVKTELDKLTDASVVTETLLKTDASWDGNVYPAYSAETPELSVVRFTLQPHAELPWHEHPLPNAAYILSGSITVEKQDGTSKHFGAGEVIAETVGSIHRGLVGPEKTTIVTFYAGLAGVALSQHPDQ